MNLKTLWKPFLLYTCLLGLLTVGAIYLATHSGFLMLIVAGGGLLLVVLGGGTVGEMNASGAERGDGAGMMVEHTGLWPHAHTDTSLRLVLLFYGVGVFLWSLIVLFTLRDTLV